MKALHLERDQLPELARAALHVFAAQLEALGSEIDQLEIRKIARPRQDETGRRLASIPRIGPIMASAIAASSADPSHFRSGRQFAAWLGLAPRAHSRGGKERQFGIRKMRDAYLRRLLVLRATAVLRMVRQRGGDPWLIALVARKKPKVAAVALVNKTSRIAWALIAHKQSSVPTTASDISVAPPKYGAVNARR